MKSPTTTQSEATASGRDATALLQSSKNTRLVSTTSEARPFRGGRETDCRLPGCRRGLQGVARERRSPVDVVRLRNQSRSGRPASPTARRRRRTSVQLASAPYSCDEWRRDLRFRECLRTYPEARNRYESVKREAAAAHTENLHGYNDGKSDCVQSILEKARIDESVTVLEAGKNS